MTISGTRLGTALLPATPPFTTGNYSPPAALGTVSAAAPTIDCAHDGSVLVLGDRNFNNGTGLNAGAVLLVTTEDGTQTWSKLPVTGAIDSEPAGLQQLWRRRPPHDRPDAEWPHGGFRLAVEPRVCS